MVRDYKIIVVIYQVIQNLEVNKILFLFLKKLEMGENLEYMIFNLEYIMKNVMVEVQEDVIWEYGGRRYKFCLRKLLLKVDEVVNN